MTKLRLQSCLATSRPAHLLSPACSLLPLQPAPTHSASPNILSHYNLDLRLPASPHPISTCTARAALPDLHAHQIVLQPGPAQAPFQTSLRNLASLIFACTTSCAFLRSLARSPRAQNLQQPKARAPSSLPGEAPPSLSALFYLLTLVSWPLTKIPCLTYSNKRPPISVHPSCVASPELNLGYNLRPLAHPALPNLHLLYNMQPLAQQASPDPKVHQRLPQPGPAQALCQQRPTSTSKHQLVFSLPALPCGISTRVTTYTCLRSQTCPIATRTNTCYSLGHPNLSSSKDHPLQASTNWPNQNNGKTPWEGLTAIRILHTGLQGAGVFKIRRLKSILSSRKT
ncbi:hypothetical protein PCANC_20364 [Puccinia coronata f. sp. avenae]|uniref:Uncharacterized protein n=1 Tax=Puccinia coronata f. sp. avenae TaxID=200324 RepID=A0A2N5U1N9_9BASI|nr:hypothetical protein PCANC_20364 [Puccinia coronata f. sp. avenae]